MLSVVAQIIALILAVLGMLELGKGKRAYWLMAAGHNASSGLAFLLAGVWGQPITHAIFFLQCVWGLSQWSASGEPQDVGYVTYNNKQMCMAVAVTAGVFAVAYALLAVVGKPEMAITDASMVAASITAHYMAGKRVIQQWWFWHATNAAGVALCLLSGLYISAFTFAVFGVLAVKGHRYWKRELMRG